MVPPHVLHKKSRYMMMMMILPLIAALVSLACGLSVDMGGEPTPDLLATQNALLATQMSLEATQQAQQAPPDAAAPAEQPPQQAGQPEQPQQPEQTTSEPPAEAVATDTPMPDVLYQDIAFSFDPAIAGGVTPQTIPAQILGEDAFPGDNHPAYDEFDFYGYALSDAFHSPVIYIYPAIEYASIDSAAAETISRLNQVLADRPADRPQDGMPFLPRWNAAQFMASNIRYLDFQNGSGVRYLTMYGQAYWPINNNDIFYTFQGLTADGAYYIAAVLPVSNPILPDEGNVDDFMAFEENFENYLADTVTQLNAQPDESFTPNLALLDAMIQSFKIR